MHSPELLKGTLQTILLKVLKDHGKMYGYEITQRVKELSDGRILLTEGALYPSLHKLEAEGLGHYDAQCPHCRRLNKVSKAELQRASPELRKKAVQE